MCNLPVTFGGGITIENFGLDKRMIHTDSEEDVEVDPLGENELYEDMVGAIETESDGQVESQISYLNSNKAILYNEFLEAERIKDEKALKDILRNKVGRAAYSEKYHIAESDLDVGSMYEIPTTLFIDNSIVGTQEISDLERQFEAIGIPR